MTATDMIADPANAASFHTFYAANLRPGLFTGFLTLSGFLFTTKQFFVIQMKQHVYGTDAYAKRIAARKVTNPKTDYSKVYGDLHRLARLLTLTLAAALATSALQFTLGFVRCDFAAAACLAAAALAASQLVRIVYEMHVNLDALFEIWESEASDKIKGFEAKP